MIIKIISSTNEQKVENDIQELIDKYINNHKYSYNEIDVNITTTPSGFNLIYTAVVKIWHEDLNND